MKTLIITCIIYFALYAAISFIGLDLDFKKWDMEVRYWFVILPLFYPTSQLISKYI